MNETTRGVIDRCALALLPLEAHLINVAHEPLAADSPLWDLPNVIATPHAAGHSDGHFRRVAELFADNLQRWMGQRPMLNLSA